MIFFFIAINVNKNKFKNTLYQEIAELLCYDTEE